MKSTLLKNSFREALSFVERVAAKSPTLPILSNIFISTKKNFLELAATDLEIGIRYDVLAKNETDGQTVVPSKFLSQFIALLPDDQITLQLKDNGLAVESRGHKTLLKTANPDDFPIIPSPKGEAESITVQTDAFCAGIAQVVGMAGQTQIRPEISGVFFSFGKDALKIVATDSFRLAEKTIPFKKGEGKEIAFILPQRASRELIAIFGDRTGKTKITPSVSQVTFEYFAEDDPSQTHIEFVSRLIEGEYPRYEDVIPKSSIAKVQMRRADLLQNLKASSIFSGKMNDVRVSVDQERGGIEFSARNAEVGENISFVKTATRGENTEVSFNWKFLSEGVAQMRSEEVELMVNGEDGPTVIKPMKEEGYLYVVMPVKA